MEKIFSKQSVLLSVAAIAVGVLSSLFSSFLFSEGFGPNYFSFWIKILIGMTLVMFFYLRNINSKKGVTHLTAFIMLAILIGIGSISIVKSQMFNSEEYLHSVTVEDANITSFETEHNTTRKVTLDMAAVLANKVIGTKYEGVQISSQYELNLDISSVQEINGELQWIIPLDYAGFSKWVKQDHVPGYVVVSATNPKAEPKLVLGKKIKASTNGYFMDDINRKLWFATNFKSFTAHIEISDNNDVYWIAPIIKPSIGFNVDTIEAVLVMNAETGDKTILSITDTMKKYPWIDRIWPEEIINERIEFYGSLKDGYWNTVFGGTNINKPTDYKGAELWLVKAGGKLQWFTGMTSTQSDQSLVSAIMVEASSKSSKPVLREFLLTGVTDEKGAVDAVEASLGADSVKWDAVLPQPVIDKGIFYWNTSIVSASNHIYQKCGVVQGNDISNVFFGETLEDAFSIKNENSLSAISNIKNKSDKFDSKDEIIAQMIKKIDELDQLKEKLKAVSNK